MYWSVRQAAGCDEIQWCFLLLFRTCKLLLPLNALLLRGPTTIMVWHFPRPTLIYILPTKENRPEQTPDLMRRSSIKIRSQLQDSMMKFCTAGIKSCRTSILISDLRNWIYKCRGLGSPLNSRPASQCFNRVPLQSKLGRSSCSNFFVSVMKGTACKRGLCMVARGAHGERGSWQWHVQASTRRWTLESS